MERLGRPCGAGGWGMGEPKGLASVVLIKEGDRGPQTQEIRGWEIKRGLSGQALGYHRCGYDDSQWPVVSLGNWKETVNGAEDLDGVGWYRFRFDVDMPENWTAPLMLKLRAETDALIYLNGHLAGRYFGIGWQREFFLPECWLNSHGANVIAVAVRNSGREGGVYEASVRPYEQSVVRRSRIVLDF